MTIVVKISKRDKEDRESKKHSNNAINLQIFSLGRGFDVSLLFTKDGNEPTFSVYHSMDPTLWTISKGIFQTSKLGREDVTFRQSCKPKLFRLILDMLEYTGKDLAPMYDMTIGGDTLEELKAVLDIKNSAKEVV